MVPGKFQQALPLFAPSRSQTRCPLKVSRQLSRTGIKRSHHSLVHARRQTSFPKQLSQNLRIKKLHTFRLLNSERARVTNTTHTPTSVEMRTPGFTQEAKGTRSGAHRTVWKSNSFPYRVAKFSRFTTSSCQRPLSSRETSSDLPAEFYQHFFGRDAFVVIVFQSLVPGNVAD